jgi:hypothetical protein
MAGASEHFAERNGRWVLILILAVCTSTAGVWAYVFLNQKPPVAAGAITAIQAVPTHYELRNGGTADQGVGGGVERTDQLFVLVQASVRNQAQTRIFPYEQTGTLTLATGEQQQSRALSPGDAAQATAAFPALASARKGLSAGLLPRETTLEPGTTEQGVLLFVFSGTKKQWDARRSFALSLPLRWQRTLIVPEPGAK